MNLAAESAHELLDHSTLINLHGDLIFSGETDSSDVFNDTEERLYDQVSDQLDDTTKLSEFIPSPPNHLMMLLNRLEQPDINFGLIQEIVRKDLGLMSEIIRISNSPLFRTRSGDITSIERAIAMLGTRGVMEIASQLLMRRVIDVNSSRFRNFSHFLWLHCLKSAEAGTVLGDKDDAFTSYLLGLVHSIGFVVALSCYIEVLGNQNTENINDLKVVRHICLEQGPWLSSKVAEEWELPDLALKTLDEFDRLCGALILGSEFDIKLNTTKTLYLSSTCAQVHSLVSHNKLDQDCGYAFLNHIGLDVDARRMAGLFERFRTLEAEES